MEVEHYLLKAKLYQRRGVATDGCSFIGWLIPKHYEPACWAHDFGRNGVIHFASQSENDNMFRNALRHLGMGKTPSNIIYYFTRFQGWFVEKTGIPATTMVGIGGIIALIVIGVWLSNP